jgi:DNA-binding MarR family transcriptional regulator
MNSTDITQKQAFGLGIICGLLSKGYAPSMSEIAQCMNVKRQTAMQVIVILERKGYIHRPAGTRRALCLTSKPLPYPTCKN